MPLITLPYWQTSGPPTTGLVGWWEVADSSASSAWADLSGNGRTLVQATSANQPAYSATSGPGSTPALTFAGSWLATAGNFPLTGNLTTMVLAVIRPNSGLNAMVLGWGSSAGALQAYGPWYGLRGSNQWSLEYAGGNPAAFTGGLASWHLMTTTKTPGAINTTSALYVNGSAQPLQAGASTGTPAVAAGPLTVGIWASNTAAASFGGSLAALLIYSVADSATRTAAETYLHAKYPSLY